MKRLVKKAQIEKMFIGFGWDGAYEWYQTSTTDLDTLIKNAPYFAAQWIKQDQDGNTDSEALDNNKNITPNAWQDFWIELIFEQDGMKYHYEWKMLPMTGGNFQHALIPHRFYPPEYVGDEDNYHDIPHFKLGLGYSDITPEITSPSITLKPINRDEVFGNES